MLKKLLQTYSSLFYFVQFDSIGAVTLGLRDTTLWVAIMRLNVCVDEAVKVVMYKKNEASPLVGGRLSG